MVISRSAPRWVPRKGGWFQYIHKDLLRDPREETRWDKKKTNLLWDLPPIDPKERRWSRQGVISQDLFQSLLLLNQLAQPSPWDQCSQTPTSRPESKTQVLLIIYPVTLFQAPTSLFLGPAPLENSVFDEKPWLLLLSAIYLLCLLVSYAHVSESLIGIKLQGTTNRGGRKPS